MNSAEFEKNLHIDNFNMLNAEYIKTALLATCVGGKFCSINIQNIA